MVSGVFSVFEFVFYIFAGYGLVAFLFILWIESFLGWLGLLFLFFRG